MADFPDAPNNPGRITPGRVIEITTGDPTQATAYAGTPVGDRNPLPVVLTGGAGVPAPPGTSTGNPGSGEVPIPNIALESGGSLQAISDNIVRMNNLLAKILLVLMDGFNSQQDDPTVVADDTPLN
jgi:hypothetical protein